MWKGVGCMSGIGACLMGLIIACVDKSFSMIIWRFERERNSLTPYMPK